MDIRGNTISFKPNEAQWAQDAATRHRATHQLAQRIQDARVELVRQWLNPDKIPPTIEAAKRDVMTRVSHALALNHLVEIELGHVEQEQPVVDVELTQEEKIRLLHLAIVDHGMARDQLDVPEICEIEDRQIWDNVAMLVATSNIMEPHEAVALGDMLRDPEVMDDYYAMQHEIATREAAILGPMIAALEINIAA